MIGSGLLERDARPGNLLDRIAQLERRIEEIERYALTSLEAGDQLNYLGLNTTGAFNGSKNIGDNTPTGILELTVDAATDWSGMALLHLVNRSSAEQGYAAVAETWLIGLRCQYNEGTSAYSMGAGTPAVLGRSDAGSASAAFSDVGNATVTVAADTTNHKFTVSVKADHTGTYAGAVFCNWVLQVFATATDYEVAAL